MSSVINTNVASLNAQRNLNSSQSALQTSLQRLSSGMRINSAKDDAAGLAISERMTSQIKGLNQASRNASDGISLAQTAEGALGEIGNNLQRIRELAVQSRNATNSTTDRAALQSEVAQLKSEIDRVAGQTSFNGTKLLDGSFTNQAFQVGADQGQTIDIAAITNAKTSALGSWTNVATAAVAASAAVATTSAASGAVNPGTLGATGDTFTLNDGGTAVLTQTAAGNAEAVTGATLDGLTLATGYTKTGTFAAGTAVISKTDGSAMTLTATVTGTSTAPTFAGSILGAATTGTAAVVGVAAVAATAQTGFAGLDVSTVTGADNAMLAMDAALTAVNGARANLGAIQNRFASVVTNLNTTSENLSASRSRIQDTDFAAETATLTRGQILQQAGTAMLAQANSLPQSVLSLLK